MTKAQVIEEIDWINPSSHLLLNPRLKAEDRASLENLFKTYSPGHSAHLWLTSSGTTGEAGHSWRLVSLSKRAFLVSAGAVNDHLTVVSKDRWFHPLPDFHVGGLGIRARAFSSDSEVIPYSGKTEKWSPQNCYRELSESRATLTSLVPTQLFDFCAAGLSAPKNLRAVLIGGAALAPGLYSRARSLGWPILTTYGFTECCSQVATAALESLSTTEDGVLPFLKIMSHVEVRENAAGCLQVKSEALLTGFAIQDKSGVSWQDPKREGWFDTQDIGLVSKGYLSILSRSDQRLKISGEFVDLQRLNQILEDLRAERGIREDAVIAAKSDDRRGHYLRLVFDRHLPTPEALLADLNERLPPLAKVTELSPVDQVPRNALGKLMYKQL